MQEEKPTYHQTFCGTIWKTVKTNNGYTQTKLTKGLTVNHLPSKGL